jgi:hypothetical protein
MQTKLGIMSIDKNDFLEANRTARIEIFKLEIFVNSFAGAGLIPFDSQRVLSKLNVRLITPPRPTSQGSDSSKNFTPKTPHTVKEVRRQASSIRRLAINDPRCLGDAIDQMEKGCQLAIHGSAIARQQITELLAANAKVARKKRRTKARIAHERSLLVEKLYRVW